MYSQEQVRDMLKYISPDEYDTWTTVGMALKDGGYSLADFDEWSRGSAKYKPGECEKKWNSYNSRGISIGSVVNMAKQRGWKDEGYEIGWDDEIFIGEDTRIIDKTFLDSGDITEPCNWQPVEDIKKYISTLFQEDEYVGYIFDSYENKRSDGTIKYSPRGSGHYRTAGDILNLIDGAQALGKDDLTIIQEVFSCSVNDKAGAWIKFNPLDGKGTKNENVTDFRYTLIESDDMDISQQYSIMKELKLPLAAVVSSGGKSIHGIVKIDAKDKQEYVRRVRSLHKILTDNGFKVDAQNKNESRWSRMPGIQRGNKKQFLIATNIGKESWQEWKEYIEESIDGLPDTENLADMWDAMPELSPVLIDGILRQGHKMMLAGPSKAGKSFALIELAVAIAEGREWFGHRCAQGRVLYINLEIDRASLYHRIKEVYSILGWKPDNISNIDIWNLRGKSAPMTSLTAKLIRRAKEQDYIAIILDPIYKVITGDENSASDMAEFCNEFDKICRDLDCATIVCHHHSKGNQSGKRSADRASGSGVFARDADALVDMIELYVTKDMRMEYVSEQICQMYCRILDSHYGKMWRRDDIDYHSEPDMSALFYGYDDEKLKEEAKWREKKIRSAADKFTAWRLEGTLREFPSFTPFCTWFQYPVHVIDHQLDNASPEDGVRKVNSAIETRKEKAADKRASKFDRLKEVIYLCIPDEDGGIPVDAVMEMCKGSDQLDVKKDTFFSWFRRNKELRDEFRIEEGKIYRTPDCA